MQFSLTQGKEIQTFGAGLVSYSTQHSEVTSNRSVDISKQPKDGTDSLNLSEL